MAGTVVLTVLGEGGGGVHQGVELVGVLADLRGQGAHRLRVGQVADQQPVCPPRPGLVDLIQDAGAAGGVAAEEHHVGAAGGKLDGGGASQHAGGAGDHADGGVGGVGFLVHRRGSLVCGSWHGILSMVTPSQM
jgi:hypothetical protein